MKLKKRKILSVIWALYAVHMQRKFYPKSTPMQYLLTFGLNLAYAPICVVIALYKKHKGSK